MATRTTSLLVQGVMAAGHDCDLSIDLAPYIDSASVIVDRVLVCALAKGIPLTVVEAEIVERWLAAYLYTRSDPIYQSKSTGGQSASFVADSQASTERYKAGAIAVDPSGCLQAILNGTPRARAAWLGKTTTEQLTFDERN